MNLKKRMFATLVMLGVTSTVASAQDVNAVYRKHFELEAKLEAEFPDRMKIKDEDEREKLKEKVVPLLKEMIANLEQIKNVRQGGGLYSWHNVEVRCLLYVFGDEETITKVDEIISSGRGELPYEDKYFAIALDYYKAETEEEKLKVIERFAEVVKENVAKTGSDKETGEDKANIHPPSGTADFMLALTPDEKTQDRILAVLHNHLASTTSAMVTIKYEMPRKLRASMNQPVSFRYPDLTGKPIQASDYKGKVLLMHFFQTNNPVAMREVGKIARLAITQKSKGLEVVSVSSDTNKADLTLWMADFKRATWPILFDPFTAELGGNWHPVALKIGVHKMPTTLLIDRKGVLRYANPKDLDVKVKELLEEKE